MPRTPITTTYTPRTGLTTTYTPRTGSNRLAVEPIQTGVWNDLVNWAESGKYWLDGGDLIGTPYTRRTQITTNYT